MSALLINHLWQSTLFAGLAALLTLAVRGNRARVRHAIWLAASMKFLIPFAMLTWLGSQIEWQSPTASAPPTNFAIVIDEVAQPFTFAPPVAFVPTAKPTPWPDILFSLWALGFLGISTSWLLRWMRIRATVRVDSAIELDLPIQAITSPTLLEPGVFGISRPVLLLPEGIVAQLTPAQFRSVVEHELCHVRHRDNLTATIHMFVETVFWFHPPVWWIGARMVAERERACDEAVVQLGNEPLIYAEAILNVCKLYVESPLTCVAGVTGAGLKQRIQAIVANRPALRLNRAKKVLLAATAAVTLATPIAIGIMNAPALQAQPAASDVPKWEAVSIKPCDSNAPTSRSASPNGRGPGRLTLTCQTVRNLFGAYAFYSNGRNAFLGRVDFEGAPAWVDSERFSIEAKSETPQTRFMMRGPMMQKLLEDRFKLKVRKEIREVPVYNLTVSKGGTKHMQPSKPGGCVELNFDGVGPPVEPSDKVHLCEMIGRALDASGGRLEGYGFSMSRFAEQLSALLDRPVIDKTGLRGTFDMDVPVAIEDLTPPKDDDPRHAFDDGEMIRGGIRQMGLRLESTKGPGTVYVIEHIERPTDNYTPPQAEEKPSPHFEVASIKPCTPDRGQTVFGSNSTGPGRLSTGCVVLAEEGAHTGLIQRAYVRYAGGRYHPFGPGGLIPIEGAPAWVHSEFFAIEAKAANPETPEMMQGPMMQKLLEERFKLRLHRETREGPVYNLMLAKNKLRPFKDGSCTNMPVPGMPIVKLKESDHFCKFGFGLGGAGSIDAEGSTVGEFISLLNLALDRQVADKTGLDGRFDIHINFSPLQSDTTEPAPDRPSIFAAIQQQLGLKLESGRGPNEFLVIDHIEKPTVN